MSDYTRSVTTVSPNGTATKMNYGDRIAEDDVQHSMEREHNRLSRAAMDDGNLRLIEEVTEAGTNIVVVYRDGSVTILHWLREEE